MRVLHEAGLVRVRQCHRGAMAYLTTDEHVGRSLDRYGEWAEAELQLLEALIGRGDTVIDVGANIGTHSVGLAQKVGLTGAVFAFEPQRAIHQLLCANTALNGLTCVRAFHAAVGNESGALLVPDIDYQRAGNFGGLSLGSWREGETVPVFTLDGLGLDRCALIKIDVEGMEDAVLAGARRLITELKPIIFIEHNAVPARAAVIERLLAHEYVCAWYLSPFFRADNFARQPDDIFGGLLDANVIAVPKARGELLRSFEPVTSPADNAAHVLARLKAR